MLNGMAIGPSTSSGSNDSWELAIGDDLTANGKTVAFSFLHFNYLADRRAGCYDAKRAIRNRR